MNKYLKTLICLSLVCLAGCAQLTIGPSGLAMNEGADKRVTAKSYPTAPAPGQPRTAKLAAPLEQTLSNGLRVVVAPRGGLPIVTAQLLILTGAEVDPKGSAGVADMTANLLTKGTRAGNGAAAMTATQIAQEAETLGGSIAASSGWHRSSLTITVTTPKLDSAVGLLAACALRPAFDAQELDRLRSQSEDSLSVALADPGRLASFASARAMFGDRAYGNMVGGNLASLKRITIAQVQRHHAQYFTAGNAALVFAGDISLSQAVAMAQKYFQAWPKGTQSNSNPELVPVLTGAPIAVDMPDAGQASVSISWPFVTRQAPDYYAGVVSNSLLGGGYSSRLNQEIRIKRGLSYFAGSSTDVKRNAATMRAAAQTKNESAAEVLKLIEEELIKLSNTAPAADELTARKATLIGNYSRSLETTEGIVGALSNELINGEPVTGITQTIAKIEAVTAGQVSTFIKNNAKPAQQRVVIVGDAKLFGAGLKAVKPQVKMVSADKIDLEAPDLGAK
jgi:zinc protease